METAIIVALITGACSVFGTWLATRAEAKKAEQKRVEEAERKAAQEATEKAELYARLTSIESKLDEHNGYGQKFVEQTGRLTAIEKTLIGLSKDIEYLKKGGA
jgi:hypothetical protein